MIDMTAFNKIFKPCPAASTPRETGACLVKPVSAPSEAAGPDDSPLSLERPLVANSLATDGGSSDGIFSSAFEYAFIALCVISSFFWRWIYALDSSIY